MGSQNENSTPTRRLNYIESQEPDELSQANALNAVDKYLSLEEEEEKNNGYTSLLHNKETHSELNLSAKLAKYLSNRNEDEYLVRKMGVFDWVNTSHEEERENCITDDVGPSTQMAAEVLEELFNAPPPKIEETVMENEIKGTEKEFSVFRHPKRRRSFVNTTLRRSVLNGLDGYVSDRLPLIMDTVTRKKRSPFIRHGNLRVCSDCIEERCEERDKLGGLRGINTGDFDTGMGYSRNKRRMHAIRVKSNMSFTNEGINRSCMHAIRVIFSQNLEPRVVRRQKKILSHLGGLTVSSMSDATHFVADRFARTKNMLEAIAMGRHVVRHDWLDSCAQAGCHVSEEKFVLRDLNKEREIGFSMPCSIEHAKRFPPLEGWRVLITPKAWPNKELLKCLVKASRGQLVERLSRYTMENEENLQGNLFIISCKEDYQICSPLLNIGIKAYESELLLNGIVTQKLEFERHRLFSGKS